MVLLAKTAYLQAHNATCCELVDRLFSSKRFVAICWGGKVANRPLEDPGQLSIQGLTGFCMLLWILNFYNWVLRSFTPLSKASSEITPNYRESQVNIMGSVQCVQPRASGQAVVHMPERTRQKWWKYSRPGALSYLTARDRRSTYWVWWIAERHKKVSLSISLLLWEDILAG